LTVISGAVDVAAASGVAEICLGTTSGAAGTRDGAGSAFGASPFERPDLVLASSSEPSTTASRAAFLPEPADDLLECNSVFAVRAFSVSWSGWDISQVESWTGNRAVTEPQWT
jgi:hypothetical protein